jgi:hypothetical protein
MTRAALGLGFVCVALAFAAAAVDGGSWAEDVLWVAALLAGSVALVAAYGAGITWARRRKRLWG